MPPTRPEQDVPPARAEARTRGDVPGAARAAALDEREPLLQVRDLEVHFPVHGSGLGRLLGRTTGSVRAVDGVSFDLRPGEVLGVVGESGSGKTTLGRALLGLAAPTGGSVRLRGQELVGLPERRLRPLRRQMQMVFQDPHASLNPAMDIETAVGHPLRIHGVTSSREEERARVVQALERVGLTPPERFLRSYPGDLSGGQKQRAVLARAVVLEPTLLVADEPVSMLDMSVRAKILELMLRLRDELGLAYVYVTHDLATAKFFCDRVAIMYLGRVVEVGSTADVFASPSHPYTQALLRAVPEPDPRRSVPRDLPRGEVPDASAPPLGCSFHPRCPKAFAVCGWESRDLRTVLEGRWAEGGEAVFDAERPLVGDLDALDEPATSVVVPAGRPGPAALLAMLERARDEDPDEPFWTGVRSMAVQGHGVAVAFVEGIDPSPYPAPSGRAACLLHLPEAGERAERLRAGPTT